MASVQDSKRCLCGVSYVLCVCVCDPSQEVVVRLFHCLLTSSLILRKKWRKQKNGISNRKSRGENVYTGTETPVLLPLNLLPSSTSMTFPPTPMKNSWPFEGFSLLRRVFLISGERCTQEDQGRVTSSSPSPLSTGSVCLCNDSAMTLQWLCAQVSVLICLCLCVCAVHVNVWPLVPHEIFSPSPGRVYKGDEKPPSREGEDLPWLPWRLCSLSRKNCFLF